MFCSVASRPDLESYYIGLWAWHEYTCRPTLGLSFCGSYCWLGKLPYWAVYRGVIIWVDLDALSLLHMAIVNYQSDSIRDDLGTTLVDPCHEPCLQETYLYSMLIEYWGTGLELEVDVSSCRQCSSRCQRFCENVYAVTIILEDPYLQLESFTVCSEFDTMLIVCSWRLHANTL